MKELFLSGKKASNVCLHIALKPDGTLQDIINAKLPFGNFELLARLLQTDTIGGQSRDTDEEYGYLFLYDGNLARPYPSVMIWKYEHAPKERLYPTPGSSGLFAMLEPDGVVCRICDMEQEDLNVIPYAVKTYLER